MTILFRAIFVCLVAVSLVACTERKSASDAAVASLLRADRVAKCDRQTIHIRAGQFGEGRAQLAEAWFDHTLLSDVRFQHVMQATDAIGGHGELSYRDGNDRFRVLWSQRNSSADVTSEDLTITACIYVPQSIEIIDSSFEKRSARVLFREQQHLSLFAQQLSNARLLGRYDPIGAPGDYEYVALLERTSAGAWRIKGIGVQ